MNVSIHDTYNLVWKIGAVIKDTAKREVLSIYGSERRKVALELIEFDRRSSGMFAGKPAKDAADEAGISMVEFKWTFKKGMSSHPVCTLLTDQTCWYEASTSGEV
jgi:phenol 2-monooxygenase (NADPH)